VPSFAQEMGYTSFFQERQQRGKGSNIQSTSVRDTSVVDELTLNLEDHPVQVMSYDARDAVRRAKTTRCKIDLPNPLVQKTTLCR
jgi:hypothetical protein